MPKQYSAGCITSIRSCAREENRRLGGRALIDNLPAADSGGINAEHNGLFDASSSEMTKALAARVWIISAWHASHPSISTLERLFNPRLFFGPRDVYATGLHAAAKLTSGRLTSKLASDDGHIVVRVAEDGAAFQVFVTSNRDELDRVTLVSPPILARGTQAL